MVIDTERLFRRFKKMRRLSEPSGIATVLRDKQIVCLLPGEIRNNLIGMRHKFKNIRNRLKEHRHFHLRIPCLNIIVSRKTGTHTVAIGTDMPADCDCAHLL